MLSCFTTWLLISPVFLCGILTRPDARNVDGLIAGSVMIALDLAFANIALANLPVSTQQCIRATAPAFTMAVEAVVHQKRFPFTIILTVMCICVGPILIAMDGAHYEVQQAWGAVIMVLSVLAGAFKNVIAHGMIGDAKNSMGIFAFTWWVELLVGLLLLPWSFWTGGVYTLLEAPAIVQLITLLAAAYGGVRILSQFFFLRYTSPTSLALSNIVVQVFTTVSGIMIFHEATTPLSVAGIIVTLSMSLVYVTLKKFPKVCQRRDTSQSLPMIPR